MNSKLGLQPLIRVTNAKQAITQAENDCRKRFWCSPPWSNTRILIFGHFSAITTLCSCRCHCCSAAFGKIQTLSKRNSDSSVNFETNVLCLCASMFANFLGEWISQPNKRCIRCTSMSVISVTWLHTAPKRGSASRIHQHTAPNQPKMGVRL